MRHFIEFEDIKIQEIFSHWIYLTLPQIIGYYRGFIRIGLDDNGNARIIFRCIYLDVLNQKRITQTLIDDPENTENLCRMIEARLRRRNTLSGRSSIPSLEKWVIE